MRKSGSWNRSNALENVESSESRRSVDTSESRSYSVERHATNGVRGSSTGNMTLYNTVIEEKIIIEQVDTSAQRHAEQLRISTEERYRSCFESVQDLLQWLSSIEKALSSQELLREFSEELKQQISSIKFIHDEIWTHSEDVNSTLSQIRQLLTESTAIISAQNLSTLEDYGDQLKKRYDRASKFSDQLHRKATNGLEELLKYEREKDTFNDWLKKACHELVEIEKGIDNQTLRRPERISEFVNEVVSHKAELRFLELTANRFVESTHEHLLVLNEMRSQLSQRLPALRKKPSEVDAEVKEISGVYNDLLDRANKLQDKFAFGNRQQAFQTAVDEAIAWLKQVTPKVQKVIDEPLGTSPREAEDQLRRAKSLKDEVVSNKIKITAVTQSKHYGQEEVLHRKWRMLCSRRVLKQPEEKILNRDHTVQHSPRCPSIVLFLSTPCQLFTFPVERDESSKQRRLTWISNIQRKGFVPNKNSVICSDHFIDRKPSAEHPYPELNLGHKEKINKPRKPPAVRSSASSQCSPSSSESAPEISIQTDEAHSTSSKHPEPQVFHTMLVSGFIQTGTAPVTKPNHDHTYAKKPTKSTKDQSTQTYPSDFIDEENVKFYTGIQSMKVYLGLVTTLATYLPKEKFKAVGITDQILLVLMRLRLGLLHEDLSFRFGIRKGLISRIISFWIPTMSSKLSILLSYIPSPMVYRTTPPAFKHRYPRLRCIIDCFEVFTERPLKLRTRAQMYSYYKSHQTAKYLLGIAPNGLITFLSAGYSGRASDLCITRNSGFLDLVESMDQIMADRGFNIGDDLEKRGASLIIPSFTKGKKQLSSGEVLGTRRIANKRIHVERQIARIKTYRVLNGDFPISQIHLLDDIMRVICMLCNLKSKLIK